MSEAAGRVLRDKLAKRYHDFHCPCMREDLSKECTCELGVYQKLSQEVLEWVGEVSGRYEELKQAAEWMIEEEERLARKGCRCVGCRGLREALEEG